MSMSVSVAFDKARADGRAALVGYLPAGFPTVDGGIDAVRALAESPHFRNLTSLDLGHNHIGEGGSEALAVSPHLNV